MGPEEMGPTASSWTAEPTESGNTELLIEFVVFGVARQISLQQFSGSL